jgi:hypothetical protein
MSDHEYTVGETVFVVEFGGNPSKRTKVTEVKTLKRGPKVTCADGSTWDVDGRCMWGHRGTRYYTGPQLEPGSDELEVAYDAVVTHRRLKWADRNFEKLTADELVALYAVLGEIRRAHKE